MNKKSHMKWSWTLMITFLVLSILDFRFGILGVLCMTAPIYHVLKGDGKAHCRSYCPRGSLLARFLEKVSLNKTMPKFMTTKKFKHSLLALMVIMLTTAVYHAGPSFPRIAFALFRFMSISLVVGIIMGIFFKPRSWCVVCPMGHASGLLDKEVKKQQRKLPVPERTAA